MDLVVTKLMDLFIMFIYVLGMLTALALVYVAFLHFTGSLNQTHFWNNRSLTSAERNALDHSKMILVAADQNARRRLAWWDIRFHMPGLGGWNAYAVVRPLSPEITTWSIGWYGENFAGVSSLELTGDVRVLRGPDNVWFFGIDQDGTQIPVGFVGSGKLFERGPYTYLPLL